MINEWASEEYDDCVILDMDKDYVPGDIILDKGIDYRVIEIDMVNQAVLAREKISPRFSIRMICGYIFYVALSFIIVLLGIFTGYLLWGFDPS